MTKYIHSTLGNITIIRIWIDYERTHEYEYSTTYQVKRGGTFPICNYGCASCVLRCKSLRWRSFWMAIFSFRLSLFKIAFQDVVDNNWENLLTTLSLQILVSWHSFGVLGNALFSHFWLQILNGTPEWVGGGGGWGGWGWGWWVGVGVVGGGGGGGVYGRYFPH